jgi:UDP-N-acetylglucosamine--N-acetylmuramyl-(pentapeptide) pyrophosphoryl-undecaprenol N-acetylglucosamine transferase
MKVLIACGGTGGHLFPGLAVAETLDARGHQVELLVSEKAIDGAALAPLMADREHARVGVRSLSAVGWRGAGQSAQFAMSLAGATRDCLELCEEFSPDVVLGMGGFTSAPAVLAAHWRKAPTMIHESNAVPGKANRFVSRFVRHVAVGLADCAQFFQRKHVTVTGTPVRAALRAGRMADARTRLGLRGDRLTVLVMGGSQGAHAINEAMACALPWLEHWHERAQFVHLSGTKDEVFVRESYDKNGFAANVMSFCNQMELAYGAADLVIARSGAATLTEIAATGLPSILVPYPHATGNHQWHNARVFERAGAARLVEQTKLDTGHHAARGERLAEAVANLLDDETQRERMARAARSLSVADAAERITSLLETYAD